MEPKWDAVLGRLVNFERGGMGVGVCTGVCARNGFTVAGLDSEYWKNASDPKCRMTCDMACRGNKRQICGGRGFCGVGCRSVYIKGHKYQ
ncbi:hypothetical protein DL767_010399 [Monosporascus sp. MG133]|nr:hypothetical protein DL767_010399 [Monosporascus sp. MG133]